MLFFHHPASFQSTKFIKCTLLLYFSVCRVCVPHGTVHFCYCIWNTFRSAGTSHEKALYPTEAWVPHIGLLVSGEKAAVYPFPGSIHFPCTSGCFFYSCIVRIKIGSNTHVASVQPWSSARMGVHRLSAVKNVFARLRV